MKVQRWHSRRTTEKGKRTATWADSFALFRDAQCWPIPHMYAEGLGRLA